MTVEEFLSRARCAEGKKIKYKLGAGGMNPRTALPSNMNNECDCSGFVCWSLGVSRQTDHPLYLRFNQGWINTDAMVYDANAETGFFNRIDEPRPGAIIVFPAKNKGSVGHVGIVTEVAPGPTGIVPVRVLHCSSGNFRTFGDAIVKTDAAVFLGRKDTIYCWYEGIVS